MVSSQCGSSRTLFSMPDLGCVENIAASASLFRPSWGDSTPSSTSWGDSYPLASSAMLPFREGKQSFSFGEESEHGEDSLCGNKLPVKEETQIVSGQSADAAATPNINAANLSAQQLSQAKRALSTDPHSIAERLRRKKISERIKALGKLVPGANKKDQVSMLDGIIEHVEFLKKQIKVLSWSEEMGAVVTPPKDLDFREGSETIPATPGQIGEQLESQSDDATEKEVARLMETNMDEAIQLLQSNGFRLIPVGLAGAVSPSSRSINFEGPINSGSFRRKRSSKPFSIK